MMTALRTALRRSADASTDEIELFGIIAEAALDLKYIAERVKFTRSEQALALLKYEARDRAAKLVRELNGECARMNTGEG